MEKAKEKCIHDGHRARLIDSAIKADLDKLSDVQIVEIFLTYIFPRGDVNPLSHRLLKRFGSLSQIVDASVQDLVQVEGINDRSAKKINLFGQMFFYYSLCKMGKKKHIDCVGDIVDIVEEGLRFRETEYIMLISISKAGYVTSRRFVSKDKNSSVWLSNVDFSSFLSSTKAAMVVVAHCHPHGFATPSERDDKTFKALQTFTQACGIELVDSYILGDDGVFSQKENRMLRNYYDVEKLKMAFLN